MTRTYDVMHNTTDVSTQQTIRGTAVLKTRYYPEVHQ